MELNLYSILFTYFSLIASGASVRSTLAASDGFSTTPPPPGWLIGRCEVGSCIAQLHHRQRSAVTKWWESHVEELNAQRTAAALGYQIGALRRRNSANDPRLTREIDRKSVKRAQERARRTRGKRAMTHVGGSPEYKRGMEELERIMRERGLL